MSEYQFWTICDKDAEGAERVEHGQHAEPAIYMRLQEYTEFQYHRLCEQAKEYLLTEIDEREGSTFHGPFSDMTHRQSQNVSELEITPDIMVVMDWNFFCCRVECIYEGTHNREGDFKCVNMRYLLPEGKLITKYRFEETRIYGHDGEEDNYETKKFWKLDKRIRLAI